jgi:hypothetical protein
VEVCGRDYRFQIQNSGGYKAVRKGWRCPLIAVTGILDREESRDCGDRDVRPGCPVIAVTRILDREESRECGDRDVRPGCPLIAVTGIFDREEFRGGSETNEDLGRSQNGISHIF